MLCSRPRALEGRLRRLFPEHGPALEISCTWAYSKGIQGHSRKNREKEIDFIARKGASAIYVQVTYLLESKNTIEWEFGARKGIKDSFPKYIIFLDNFDMSRTESSTGI